MTRKVIFAFVGTALFGVVAFVGVLSVWSLATGRESIHFGVVDFVALCLAAAFFRAAASA